MTPVWVSAVTRPLLQIVVATLLLLACTITPVYSYTSGVNHIDRRAIAGLWRLTPRVVSLKEFTVHPKKENKAQEEAEEEMLLMLKEDGSFQRYEEPKETTTSRTSKEGTADIDQSWKQFVQTNQEKKKDPTKMLFKGTWDFRDGELILAADRDAVLISKSDNLGSSTGTGIGTGNAIFGKKDKDTILVGPVVLTKNRQPVPETPSNIRVEEQLQEGENATSSTTAKSKNPPPTFSNNQLSVPMGSVQVGRFMYPKSHPSFFEQPMFQPKRLQNFQLKQVLGNANAFQQPEEDQLIEKFRNKDFYNKTFFMTSHPIEPKKPKGRSRWSIKYNKFVGKSVCLSVFLSVAMMSE